ncbi:TPA: TrkA C-terminal domain-containing protein, partial [Clostridioides difficile]
ERDMGVRVAHNLVSDNILDHIELDPEYSIVEIVTPNSWVGKTLIELELRARYEITVLAIKTGKNINVTPSPDEELTAGSILVIIGQNTSITAITSGNKGIIRRR